MQASAASVTHQQAAELEALRQELDTLRAQLAAAEAARARAEGAAAQASAAHDPAPALQVCTTDGPHKIDAGVVQQLYTELYDVVVYNERQWLRLHLKPKPQPSPQSRTLTLTLSFVCNLSRTSPLATTPEAIPNPTPDPVLQYVAAGYTDRGAACGVAAGGEGTAIAAAAAGGDGPAGAPRDRARAQRPGVRMRDLRSVLTDSLQVALLLYGIPGRAAKCGRLGRLACVRCSSVEFMSHNGTQRK